MSIREQLTCLHHSATRWTILFTAKTKTNVTDTKYFKAASHFVISSKLRVCLFYIKYQHCYMGIRHAKSVMHLWHQKPYELIKCSVFHCFIHYLHLIIIYRERSQLHLLDERQMVSLSQVDRLDIETIRRSLSHPLCRWFERTQEHSGKSSQTQ